MIAQQRGDVFSHDREQLTRRERFQREVEQLPLVVVTGRCDALQVAVEQHFDLLHAAPSLKPRANFRTVRSTKSRNSESEGGGSEADHSQRVSLTSIN